MARKLGDPEDLGPTDTEGPDPKAVTPPDAGPTNDVYARTLAVQGRPLPIVHGTRKVAVFILEKTPSVKGAPPQWTSFGRGAQFSLDFIIAASGNAYKCIVAGAIGGTEPSGSALFVDGSVTWQYIQAMPMDVYTQKFLGALCEGEIAGAYGNLWWDKELIPVVSAVLPGRLLALVKGQDNEAQVITVSYDTSGYQHTAAIYPAYDAIGAFSLTQAEVPQIALGTKGVMFAAATLDVNPGDVVNDILTHSRRGCSWPSSRVDPSITGTDPGQFRVYCDAAGFRFSTYYDTQRTALDMLAEVLQATNSDAVWSGGALKIVPLGDQPIPSPVYGATGYVPANTARYNLGLDDFLDKEAPISVTRRPDDDCFNSIPVQYVDRAASYASLTLEDPDQSDVEVRGGLKRGATVNLSFAFPDGSAPVMLSRIYAQRSLNVRNTYTFRLPWKYILLEPTDVVTLTDANAGFSLKPVRITEMREEADGSLSFVAEDYPSGVAAAASYAPQAGDGYVSNDKLTRAQLPTTVDSVHFGTAPGAVQVQGLSYSNFDNLWPNPNSETDPLAGVPVLNDGSSPEWDFRYVEPAGGAYAGSHTRRLQSPNKPVFSALADATGGGALHFNTTYAYRVSAIDSKGRESLAFGEASILTANDALNTHKVTLSWASQGDDTASYKVYGRTAGAEQLLATVAAGVLSYVDDGSATPAGALPSTPDIALKLVLPCHPGEQFFLGAQVKRIAFG